MPFAQYIYLTLRNELSKYVSIKKIYITFDDYDTVYCFEQDFLIEVLIKEDEYLADILALGSVEDTINNIAKPYYGIAIDKKYI